MSELFSLGDTAGTYDHIRSLSGIIPDHIFQNLVSIEQSDFLTRETYELNETIKENFIMALLNIGNQRLD